MIVLKTLDEWKAGQKNTVPHLGDIEIDSECKIYVHPSLKEKAQALVDLDINFEFHSEEDDLIAPKVEEDDLSKTKKDDDPLSPQTNEPEILGSSNQLELGFVYPSSSVSTVEEVIKTTTKIDRDSFDEERTMMIAMIMKKNQEDLRELCVASSFPVKEWKNLTKIDLRQYLVKKLKQ